MLIDIVVFIVILISALISFLRGFIRETLTIVGTVGAVLAAYFFGPLLSPHIAAMMGVDPNAEFAEPEKLFGIIPYDVLASILAYGSIFIVVIIVLSLLSHMIAETAKSVGLGAIDRTLGVVFGIVRGVLILGLLNLPIYIFAKDPESRPDFINDAIESSGSYFYIDQVSAMIENLIPEDAQDQAMDSANETIKNIDVAPAQQKIFDQIIKKPGAQNEEPQPEDSNDAKGYSEDFRNKMDQLIQQEQKEEEQP